MTAWSEKVGAVLLVAALSAGCGSTVPMASQAAQGGGDGLSVTPGDSSGTSHTIPGSTATAGAGESGTATSAGPGSATGSQAPGRFAGATAGGPGSTGAPGARIGLPGVTDSTITVGVFAADPSANTTLKNAGFGAAALGDEPASWRAMANDLNAQGGVAGRKLKLIFYLVNLVDSPAQQGQAACTKFTQDNKVAVVLSGYYWASLHGCLSHSGVPALLGTNYGVDAKLARSLTTVIAWASPLLDRLAVSLPAAFRGLGALKSGTSAGLLVVDAPEFLRSADVVTRALTREGVKVTVQTVKDSASGDYGAATSDASAAVLKFRSAGVTEVFFLSHNAFEPTLLMQAANSQRYRPKYLLTSQQYPNGLVGLVPKDQLRGAVGIGWAPAIDLSSGYDTSPRAQQCLKTLKANGGDYSSSTETLAGLLACDGSDLLRRAAESPGGLSSTAAFLRAAVASNGFVSAVTLGTKFTGGRRDGVDGYRPISYAATCGCFTYSGGLKQL